MDLATYKKFKGDRLMPWGKATVVKDAKGYVFLAGNTATGEDYDPLNQRGGAIGDPAMQWRAILANIKSDLEEVGVLRQGTISKWWRSQLTQFSSRRVG